MSIGNEKNVGSTTVDHQHFCPVCGGPAAPHEETTIRLGHPDRVRHRYRCVDPRCGAAILVDGPGPTDAHQGPDRLSRG